MNKLYEQFIDELEGAEQQNRAASHGRHVYTGCDSSRLMEKEIHNQSHDLL